MFTVSANVSTTSFIASTTFSSTTSSTISSTISTTISTPISTTPIRTTRPTTNTTISTSPSTTTNTTTNTTTRSTTSSTTGSTTRTFGRTNSSSASSTTSRTTDSALLGTTTATSYSLSILTTFYSTSKNFSTPISTFGSLPILSSNLALINPSLLFTSNNAGSQLNGVLSSFTGDLSGCLGNCSNQGLCVLNSLQQFICHCNEYKTGKACQNDLRSCSSNPCLNNGTCSNIMNNNETSFQCFCQSNLYYGAYCENKIDLCLNNTDICSKNQGYCIVNDTKPECKCLMGYSGTKCEILSTSLVVRKAIINASSIIAIIVFAFLVILIIAFDYTKFFLMKQPAKKITKVNRLKYHN
jgi:hypothetical protein